MERDSMSIQTGTNERNRGLVIPNLYRVSNIPIDALSISNYSSQKKIYSLYGTASMGFMDQIYLDVTARNDWSSTLLADNRSYFYPSASLSWMSKKTFSLAVE